MSEELTFEQVIHRFGRVMPLLNELENTPQDAEWHAEGDVATHTKMVMETVGKLSQDLCPESRTTLEYAAAFHDIAKPITTRERERDGRVRIVSPRHAQIGRSYLALRAQCGADLEIPNFENVIALVGHHHDLRKLVLDNLPRRHYARLSRLCQMPLLYTLCKADMLGRICPDQAAQVEQVELFKLQAQEWACWDENPYEGWDESLKRAFPGRSVMFYQHALAVSIHDYENGVINSIHEAIPRAYNISEKTYTLTLLCGPSGSGKSTWIEQHANDEVVISLDEIRQEIAGKRDNQSKNGQVMQAAKERLKQALREKKSIIWDATNTRVDGRKWVVDLGRDYGAFTKVICLQTPISELVKRNKKRSNPIPTNALMHQIDRMEYPFLDEADSVEYIRSSC